MPRWIALLVWLLIGCPVAANAADWPTYRKDARRSGITDERLATPLSQAWVFKCRFAPQPSFGPGFPKGTNWEGGVEKRRIDFDRADAVVVAAGKAYFGSVGDGKVYCLDAKTGRVVWTFRTDGPVRLAPTISGGRAYFGSDDGRVYCADAATGKLIWDFRAAPDDHKIIGSGRLISLWPVRTGVLVDRGIAYFSAGIFPSEGVFMYAVDANTGRIVWKNDREGESRLKQISPQGYLLVTDDVLIAPLGRIAPGLFDRKTGNFLHKLSIYYGGGTFGTLHNDWLFTGWEDAYCFRVQSEPAAGHHGTSANAGRFPGGKLVYADGVVYSCAVPHGQGKSQSVKAIRWRVPTGESASPTENKNKKRRAEADPKSKPVDLWSVPFDTAESIIYCGDALLVGGKNVVAALDPADGKTRWSQKVEGSVLHLAAAGGHLYASTDTGRIYCFGPAGTKPLGEVAEATETKLKVSDTFRAAADAILRLTPDTRKGFALVYGVETGELALELARRTELKIVAVSPDEKKVEAARALLDKAGYYGGRAVVVRRPLENVPLTKYFANLVVSEKGVLTGKLPGSAAEVHRMTAPVRGTVVLGGPARGEAKFTAQALATWAADTQLASAKISTDGDWAVFRRPALKGAGRWTDQYGCPGATGTSEDDLVRAPFRVQWFGEPGAEHMVDRHYWGVAPLAADGRLFVCTVKGVHALDAYNGTRLWFYPLPNAARPYQADCSGNAVIAEEGYFIAVDDVLRLLDLATGKVLKQYKLPAAADGKRRSWGYLAVADGTIIGSRTWGHVPVQQWTTRGAKFTDFICNDILFGMDAKTGRTLWEYKTEWFRSNVPVLGEGVVFIGHARGAAGDPLARAIAEKEPFLKTFSAAAREKLAKQQPWTMILAALDLKTGTPKWKRIVDASVCGGERATLAYKDGVLYQFSSIGSDKSFDGLSRGRWAHRVIVARNADSGDVTWMKNYDYRGRIAVVADTIYAEPFALDARTGERKMVEHPLSGQKTPWFFVRPYKNCGPFNASKHCLFFRNHSIGYYDANRNEGTATFDSHRPSCWMSFNSANGLATFAAGGSACRCPAALQGTVVLVHDDESRTFGEFSLFSADLLPIKRLFLNLGAPGDSRDEQGQLWLAHPRKKFRGGFQLPVEAKFFDGGRFKRRNSIFNRIAETDVPWVYNSAAEGLKTLAVSLRGPGRGTAKYGVKLLFSAPHGDRPQQRVFDVKLQGKVVGRSIDVVERAGAANAAVVLTFDNVAVGERLVVEFVPKKAAPNSANWPILNGLMLAEQ